MTFAPCAPKHAPWHYIDVPLGTKHRERGKILRSQRRMRNTRHHRSTGDLALSAMPIPQKRADALRFVIHFVGDLHQPLHAATNNDEGGNCVPVAFFGALPQLRYPQTESYAPNLHGVWDTNILAKATTGKTVEQVAAELDRILSEENCARGKKVRRTLMRGPGRATN